MHLDPQDTGAPHEPSLTAELVIPVSEQDVLQDEVVEAEFVQETTARSWVFRCVDGVSWATSRAFGVASIILILAVLANIPIVQFIAFGYMLAVSGRIAQSGKLRSGFLHADKATRASSIIVGTALVLLPARLISWFHSEAFLIDPTSGQTRFLNVLLIVVIALTIPHIMAAWFCGGKLRYFFWPLIAPFSFALWLAKKAAGAPGIRNGLEACTRWISPNLVDDLVAAKPVTDWFLPAILFKHIGDRTLISNARDNLWDFVASWKLGELFKLGFLGFLGSFIWLAPPTALMFRAIGYDDGLAVFCGLTGILMATVVFGLLPFLQTLFAETGNFSSFFDLGEVYSRLMRAPFMHLLSLLVMMLLALPLLIFKIEEIPSELLWILSVVFVTFSLPGRFLTGWAVGKGKKRPTKRAWWYRWPVALLMPAISFTFAFIFFFSPFVAWYGGYSLFENHVFLLPAPFWVSYFL